MADTPPSLHRYLYAYGNPTVYFDPNGRESAPVQRSWTDENAIPGGAKYVYDSLTKKYYNVDQAAWGDDAVGYSVVNRIAQRHGIKEKEVGLFERAQTALSDLWDKYFGEAREKKDAASDRFDRSVRDSAQRVSGHEEEIEAYERHRQRPAEVALVLEDATGAGVEMVKGAARAADDASTVAGAPGLIKAGVRAGIRSGIRELGEEASERVARRRAVSELYGEGPESAAISEVSAVRAGVSRLPRHHVLPQEHRAWFEERGFVGDLDIDNFTVELQRSTHEAIHGGGDWRLGRTWPDEWNQRVMRELVATEKALGRRLSSGEVFEVVGQAMKGAGIDPNFVPYGGGR
jgi:hypothetical protein